MRDPKRALERLKALVPEEAAPAPTTRAATSLQMAGSTHAGRAARNDDCLWFGEIPLGGGRAAHVCALADGLSAEAPDEGSLASEIAIGILTRRLETVPPPFTDIDHARKFLALVFEEINSAILSRTKDSTTSLVVSVAIEGKAVVASVGDSLGLLVTERECRRVTGDAALARSLGNPTPPRVELVPETGALDLPYGSFLILCSKGLTGSRWQPLYTPEEIRVALFGTPELRSALDHLVTLAYRKGSKENITAVGWEYGMPRRSLGFPALPAMDKGFARPVPARVGRNLAYAATLAAAAATALFFGLTHRGTGTLQLTVSPRPDSLLIDGHPFDPREAQIELSAGAHEMYVAFRDVCVARAFVIESGGVVSLAINGHLALAREYEARDQRGKAREEYRLALTCATEESERAVSREALERLSAPLARIRSAPPGAAVTLDGRPVGTTPLDLDELAPGVHELRFELAGHDAVVLRVEHVSGRSELWEAAFSPLRGTIVVNGLVAGDRVIVFDRSGERLAARDCTTPAPFTWSGPEGDYVILVERKGMAPFRRGVTLVSPVTELLADPWGDEAQRLEEAGKLEDALAAYEMSASPGKGVAIARVCKELARRARAENRIDAMYRMARRARDLAPGDPEAVRLSREAEELRTPEGLLAVARACRDQGRFFRAAEAYRSSLDLRDDPEVRREMEKLLDDWRNDAMSRAAARLGAWEFDAAEPLLNEALQARPQDDEARKLLRDLPELRKHLTAGRAHAQAGLWKEAARSFEAALALRSDPRAAAELASAKKKYEDAVRRRYAGHLERGEWADAQAAARELAELEPRLLAEAQALEDRASAAERHARAIRSARSAAQDGRWKEAARGYREAAAALPEDATARKELSDVLGRMYDAACAEAAAAIEAGQWDRAEEALAEAEEARPGGAETQKLRASLSRARELAASRARLREHAAAARWSAVRQEAGRILAIEPTDREALDARIESLVREALNRAEEAERARRWEDAAAAYAEALRFRPGDPGIEQAAIRARLRRRANPLQFQRLRTLAGHDDVVSSAWSPDGSRLATASIGMARATLHLWNPATGAAERTEAGEPAMAWPLAFHPKEPALVSAEVDASGKSRVRTRSLAAWDSAADWQTNLPRVYSLAVSEDGRIALGGQDVVHVREATSRTLVTHGGHAGKVLALAFSRDGVLATGDEKGFVRIFGAGAAPERQWETQDGEVRALAWLPESGLLATAGGNRIRLWKASGEGVATLTGHEGEVRSIAFHPGSAFLASGSADGTLRIWSVPEGKEVRRFSAGAAVWSLAFRPDGSALASTQADGSVILWAPPE